MGSCGARITRLARRVKLTKILKQASKLPLSLFQSPSPSPSPQPPTAAAAALNSEAWNASRRMVDLFCNAEDANIRSAIELLSTSPEQISSLQAANLISKTPDPLTAHHLYAFLQLQPAFQPRPLLYYALLKNQLKSRNPDSKTLLFYLHEMRQRGLRFSSPNDYVLLYGSFLRVDLPIADHIYDLMKQHYELVPIDDYNMLLRVCLKRRAFKRALRIANDMRNMDLVFNEDTFRVILSVCQATKNAREAVSVFHEMESVGVLPDNHTYDVLLRILTSRGLVNRALLFLDEMRLIGLKPSHHSLCRLIRVYLKHDNLQGIESLIRNGVFSSSPEALIFLIDHLFRMDSVPQGIRILSLLQEIGASDFDDVYAFVARWFCDKGLIHDALKICTSLPEVDMNENLSSAILAAYCKADMPDSAKLVYETMNSKGFKTKECYLSLMSLYANLGRLDDAMRMFEDLKKDDFSLDIDTYSVIVDVVARSSRLSQAHEMVVEMRKSGILPGNSIYASLINAYMSAGYFENALSLVEEFRSSGICPDANSALAVSFVLGRVHKYSDLETWIGEVAKAQTFYHHICLSDYKMLTRVGPWNTDGKCHNESQNALTRLFRVESHCNEIVGDQVRKDGDSYLSFG